MARAVRFPSRFECIHTTTVLRDGSLLVLMTAFLTSNLDSVQTERVIMPRGSSTTALEDAMFAAQTRLAASLYISRRASNE